ncbi:hypothetical protein GCM10010965_11800 [Caldalkalibacillus thermarum]|nr:hypothetical protein [Caldalkalibacillus thermarum]GGK20411.1 hypothetical protein GCM10010965_11800 [Caldalkalibacillus thermarum]
MTIPLSMLVNGKDEAFAAVGVTLSTLLAMVTIPVLYTLAHWLGHMWFS